MKPGEATLFLLLGIALTLIWLAVGGLALTIWLPQAKAHPHECAICADVAKKPEIAKSLPAHDESPQLDLGEFQEKCGHLVPIARAAWDHQNPHWKEFFPAFMYQIALESSCNVQVVNSIDAAGLLQLLRTAASDCRKAGIHGSRREAIFNLECSAWLQHRSGRAWRSHRSEECRVVLVWIGHLTGTGHLINAQKVARQNGEHAVCAWDGILEYLSHVITEDNAKHAAGYAWWIASHSGVAKDKLSPAPL